MHRLFVCLFLVAACATSPDEQPHTIYVGFDRMPTDSDIAELESIGSSLQYRLNLTRAVTLRSSLPADAFDASSGVIATHDLGEEDDQFVSLFIQTDGPPTEADAEILDAAGARSSYVIGGPTNLLVGVILLSKLPGLDGGSRFVKVEIDFQDARIQPGS